MRPVLLIYICGTGCPACLHLQRCPGLPAVAHTCTGCPGAGHLLPVLPHACPARACPGACAALPAAAAGVPGCLHCAAPAPAALLPACSCTAHRLPVLVLPACVCPAAAACCPGCAVPARVCACLLPACWGAQRPGAGCTGARCRVCRCLRPCPRPAAHARRSCGPTRAVRSTRCHTPTARPNVQTAPASRPRGGGKSLGLRGVETAVGLRRRFFSSKKGFLGPPRAFLRWPLRNHLTARALCVR
jgi:hypothetical protein